VTRDDLSSEALQESTMRIQGLAEAWARRQGVQEGGEEIGMEPPHPLPPPVRRPRGAILGEILLISRKVVLKLYESAELTNFSFHFAQVLGHVWMWWVRLAPLLVVPSPPLLCLPFCGLGWDLLGRPTRCSGACQLCA